ncbi:glycosyltransferase [uncultured Brevundimonas sp.]|uniref:glycosyltransferase n=1 Tax=uncultured Brevundimonas sp. TaxID=213418 RepID=UPI00262E8887|nr:glycosyltransferase [uncultured Brevundimonas sp.]
MKLLHVTNAYPYAEVPEYGIFVKEQIESVAASGVDSDLVFMNGRLEGKGAYLRGIKEIRRKARAADVIHCHHLYSGLATYLAFTGKPIVLSFLNDWLHEMDGVGSVAVRKILCNVGVMGADCVIFKSPIPPQFRGESKFVHLPNGADAQRFHITDRAPARARLGLDPKAFYLLFVSSKDQFRAQKRYDRFKACVDHLQAAHPERDVRELILVNQPRDRVLDFFNAADVHLMTSDFEGSPNSVKEALCCGVPVVTTDVGNVRDMLDGVPHAYVANAMEPAELVGLVERLFDAPVDRQAIREGFLSKGISKEAVLARLIDIYKSLSKQRTLP